MPADVGMAAAGPMTDADRRHLFERVTARYGAGSRFTHNFVYWKLKTDPVHATVVDLARRSPLGRVVDVGCGHGQLGVALLEAGLADAVIGLDVNARHLSGLDRAASGLAYRTEVQDLSAGSSVPAADTVLVIDVLHMLPTEAQEELLGAVANAAARRIVIRTLDPDLGWRSTLTRSLETMSRRVWPNAGRHVNPRPLPWISSLLAAEGFAVEVEPCWHGTPFASVLLVAERAGYRTAQPAAADA